MNDDFRLEVRNWLEQALAGRFAGLKGIADLCTQIPERRAFEQALGGAKLSCIGWPAQYGGRGANIADQVIMAEEYARAKAPARIGHLGIELIGPTLIAYGTEDQKTRFLPDIAQGNILWAQGYSEPGAGSDLANIRTKARLDGDKWIIDGQKIWTSLGMIADWIFAVVRTDPASKGPKGLSFLLIPMDQSGITVRPIRQMTGEAEFAEVFFDGAETAADNIIGVAGDGWRIAMALLGFERGLSTVVQQMHFATELDMVIAAARENGRANDPIFRQRIAQSWTGLQVMRFNMLRMLDSEAGGELGDDALTSKLYWSRWHRDLGDLAMDVLGDAGLVGDGADYHFNPLVQMHLSSRADTIYAGSSQIQRNIIAERGLELPKEPRGVV